MPKTPTGAKRPADVIGNAVHVMRIAIGEIEDAPATKAKRKPKSGPIDPQKRREIAQKAASARWAKKP